MRLNLFVFNGRSVVCSSVVGFMSSAHELDFRSYLNGVIVLLSRCHLFDSLVCVSCVSTSCVGVVVILKIVMDLFCLFDVLFVVVLCVVVYDGSSRSCSH